jgi:uncharacterized YigZ family protein
MTAVPASYLTIARDGDIEIEAKRSRFLCRLRRVGDEEQVRAVVQQARKEHPQARHHCSAIVLGPDAAVQRSSDDGEPAGTAGGPMLEALRGRDVSDVVAVVSRYFGGTLLGTGGLVRAYSHAVRTCLDEVGVVRRSLVRVLDVAVPHAAAGRVEHDLRAFGFPVRDVTYGDHVTVRLALPHDAAPRLEALLAQLGPGLERVAEIGEDWVDAGEGGTADRRA